MSEIRIPLEYHGPYGTRSCMVVELNDEGDVYLTIEGEPGSDEPTLRTLTPAEARALAAALQHYAAEGAP